MLICIMFQYNFVKREKNSPGPKRKRNETNLCDQDIKKHVRTLAHAAIHYSSVHLLLTFDFLKRTPSIEHKCLVRANGLTMPEMSATMMCAGHSTSCVYTCSAMKVSVSEKRAMWTRRRRRRRRRKKKDDDDDDDDRMGRERGEGQVCCCC